MAGVRGQNATSAERPTDTGKRRETGFFAGKLAKRELHPARLERATFGSVDRCSIQLSYGCYEAKDHRRRGETVKGLRVSRPRVGVQELDADFLVFSGHKLYGPSGVGVLHGKAERLEAMPPYQGGGDMIERVSFAGTTWNEIPFKFEAGTPDIAGIVVV